MAVYGCDMCLHPITAWRSKVRSANGKRGLVFDVHAGFVDQPVDIACGQCQECRLQKARDWAMRCNHEAAMHQDNCFVTLTYDDVNLPKYGSLEPDHLSTFMKDLREWYRYRLNKFGSRKVKHGNG